MEMCKTLLGFAHFHRHGWHELKTTKPDTSLATKTGHFHLLPTDGLIRACGAGMSTDNIVAILENSPSVHIAMARSSFKM
jgi:hypothetical protein